MFFISWFRELRLGNAVVLGALEEIIPIRLCSELFYDTVINFSNCCVEYMINKIIVYVFVCFVVILF